MAQLTWGNPGERLFEVGVDRGVLYPRTGPGVAWSGLISVSESPTGGDPTPFYMDGIKYQDRGAAEEFAGTIEAFTYPAEFGMCDGSSALATGLFTTQQYRQPFGFSYRTKVGNDLNGIDYGYKIHIVYNARTTPSERGNQSISDNPEAMTFSWGFTTIPVTIAGVRPSAHIVIDSTSTDPLVLETIEAVLYGSDVVAPSLPTPADLLSIFIEAGPVEPFVALDLGDGTLSVSGPSFAVIILDTDSFQLDHDTVTDLGDGSYSASSDS